MKFADLLRYTHAVLGRCPVRGFTVLELAMSDHNARQSARVWSGFGYAEVEVQPINEMLKGVPQ